MLISNFDQGQKHLFYHIPVLLKNIQEESMNFMQYCVRNRAEKGNHWISSSTAKSIIKETGGNEMYKKKQIK